MMLFCSVSMYVFEYVLVCAQSMYMHGELLKVCAHEWIPQNFV